MSDHTTSRRGVERRAVNRSAWNEVYEDLPDKGDRGGRGRVAGYDALEVEDGMTGYALVYGPSFSVYIAERVPQANPHQLAFCSPYARV